MANQYTQVSITGYNSNPPDDDGSETDANRVKWATIKTKITDPVKTRTDTMDTNIASAFGKIDGGVTSSATDYSVLESDQGKLVRATASGITFTTPDAANVGAPFVFAFLNDSTGDVTVAGYDTQTVDGLDSVTVPAGAGFRMRTNGTNWFTEGRNYQRTLGEPQGYLSVLSVSASPLSPMPTNDQSAKTAVYYRPDKGNLVPISNGTVLTVRDFSELTLTLNSNHVASGIYDVFLFDDSGTITIGTGPVWNTVTEGSGARGTGAGTTELDLLQGFFVNKVSMTARNGSTTYTVAAKAGVYVGSIYIDTSAGQVTCSVSAGQGTKWGVWNAYNRRKIAIKQTDSTTSWQFNASTVSYRSANSSSSNVLYTFTGLADEVLDLRYTNRGTWAVNGSTVTMGNAIGFNTTSDRSGLVGASGGGQSSVISSGGGSLTAAHLAPPSIGVNRVYALEWTSSSITASFTYFGSETNMLLSANYYG